MLFDVVRKGAKGPHCHFRCHCNCHCHCHYHCHCHCHCHCQKSAKDPRYHYPCHCHSPHVQQSLISDHYFMPSSHCLNNNYLLSNSSSHCFNNINPNSFINPTILRHHFLNNIHPTLPSFMLTSPSPMLEQYYCMPTFFATLLEQYQSNTSNLRKFSALVSYSDKLLSQV